MKCQAQKIAVFEKKNEEVVKARKLAEQTAELDSKTQIIIEFEGKLSIISEDCWIDGGMLGTPIEFFIV